MLRQRQNMRSAGTAGWSPGDHIAVALSGGKNSSALLYFLKKLTADRRDIRLSAITIDEGIAGYSDPVGALQIARALDIECFTVSFQETFGITADGIASKKGTGFSPAYCNVLRHFLLNRIALENGVKKIALGETLDDGAVSVLKNILQGTPERLVGFKMTGLKKIPLIRPFISIPQKEVELYADHSPSWVQPVRIIPIKTIHSTRMLRLCLTISPSVILQQNLHLPT